jgi:hypothetical protein
VGEEFARKSSNDADMVPPVDRDAPVLSDDLCAKLPGDTATT